MKRIFLLTTLLLIIMVFLTGCLPINLRQGDKGASSMKEYTLEDMTFKAPIFMEHEEKDTDTGKVHNFIGSGCKIQFTTIHLSRLTAPPSSASSIFAQIQGPSFIGPVHETIINGTSWSYANLASETPEPNKTSRSTTYSYSDGMTQYVVNFLYAGNATIEYTDAIMAEVVISRGNLKTGKNLIGEWANPQSGNLVIYDNGKLEFYKDSTKSKDNVLTAVYSLFDKKLGSDFTPYDENYYVVMRYDTNTIDGVYEKTDYLREYCFSVSGDTMYVTNIYNAKTFTMTRVVK